MGTLNFLKQINRKMNKRKIIPAEEQLEFLQAFPEPQDDFERSYYQYLCQNKLLSNSLIKIIRDIFAFPLLVILFLWAKIKARKKITLPKKWKVFFFLTEKTLIFYQPL